MESDQLTEHDPGAFAESQNIFHWEEATVGHTDAKRQHFVPRMWLNRFTDASDLLRVWDVHAGTEHQTSPTNVAVIGRYYDISLEDDIVSVEPWLSQLENTAAPILDALIDSPDCFLELEPRDQHHLARFLAATYFRNPAYRSEIDSMMQNVAKQANAAFPEADIPFTPTGTDAAHVAQMLQETQGWANLLMFPPWRIGRTTGDLPAFLSDNPMSKWVKAVRHYWELGTPIHRFTYWIPLAPDTILKIDGSDSKSFANSENYVPVREVKDFNEWEVSICRHVVTANATQYLYGEGPVVTPSCALSCLQRIDLGSQILAVHLGFEPEGASLVPPADHWADKVKALLGENPSLDPIRFHGG